MQIEWPSILEIVLTAATVGSGILFVRFITRLKREGKDPRQHKKWVIIWSLVLTVAWIVEIVLFGF